MVTRLKLNCCVVMGCIILLMPLLLILVLGEAGVVFTSFENMKMLLETHRALADSVQQYVLNMEENMGVLKQYLARYQAEANKAMLHGAKYLENPINAFTLVKRMTTDADRLEDLLNKNIEMSSKVGIGDDLLVYPDAEDLTESALALLRLQEYYKLHTGDLARGFLDEIDDSNPMTVSDCYDMGSEMLKQGEYLYALDWMKEAFDKAQDELPDIPIQKIMEKLAITYHQLNNTEGAIGWNNRVLQISQTESALERKIMLNKVLQTKLKNGDETTKVLPTIVKLMNDSSWEIYQGLCRGEYHLQYNITKRLKCRYETSHHPFLMLAPMKLEEIFLDPDVLMYHDVVMPRDAQAIIDLSKPKLRRSEVLTEVQPGRNSAGSEVKKIRVSENTWLRDRDSPVVARLSRRLSDMTGLETSYKFAESLQVANYFIGGYYQPHLDPMYKKAPRLTEIVDDRIATVILYLNDVNKGGGTVFLRLGVLVEPRQGSALLFRNLHPSGEIDESLLHGACPVLRGQKWIATKWIHERGQEFRAPCTTEYRGENYTRNLPLPVPQTKLNEARINI